MMGDFECCAPPPDHVYTVQVGGGSPIGICSDLAHVDQLIVRYLALCWPKADREPAERYQFGDRREDYHAIPAGEYTGGELLPVIVQRVYLWTPEKHWPPRGHE